VDELALESADVALAVENQRKRINDNYDSNGSFLLLVLSSLLLLLLLLQQFYIVPFKVIYLQALPAQPRSNNVDSRPERNRAEWPTGIVFFSTTIFT